MSKEKVMVFFDESGKRNNKPNLMGGLSIPHNVYCLDDFQALTQALRDRTIKLHFKNYSGDSKEREHFIQIGEVLAKFANFIRIIIINYNYSALAGSTELGKDLIEDMIYTKFPERILYGLLRGYGKNINIEAEVLIEQATEYESLNLFQLKDKHNVKLKLDDLAKDLLNIQSLYRGENYVINDCRLVPKGEEIGVEMTDMLLGVVRTILENKDSLGVKSSAKNKLTMRLLQNDNFYSLIQNIRYFEWDQSKELPEINLTSYLQLFMAKHFSEALN
ncbi:MAG: hypothetical protein K6T72_08055 [Anoxybacillus sp.]|nr:DUF3800 domain-containing protein [Anoxybacillus sp.]MCL6586449.1 hypothetical protein [Anoxybacillus sp.]